MVLSDTVETLPLGIEKVYAAIAHMGDVGVVAVNEHDACRGTHAFQRWVGIGSTDDLKVGAAQGIP